MNQVQALIPGASVGVIGGGQLGRYFVIAARRMGYVTYVLDPDGSAPAMQLCEHKIIASYDDEAALTTLAKSCDAVTIEFENVPASSLELIAGYTRIAPPAAAVTVAQERHAEKQAARDFGLQTAPYVVIKSQADIDTALDSIALPAIIKTSRLGYDGKGQQTCHTLEDVSAAFNDLGRVECVLEQRINLKAEVSVVLARGSDGQVACFPVAQNVHTNGILATSVVPATAGEQYQQRAQDLAVKLAHGLQYEGVLAIEFFIDENDQLLFNEMAPRPHNSGHYTLDATQTCQFEQQLRALCALPLGSTQLLSSVCMLNVLGDIWPDKGEPAWSAVMQKSGAHLHLYGKAAARPGRKMGHINCLAADSDTALANATELSTQLSR